MKPMYACMILAAIFLTYACATAQPLQLAEKAAARSELTILYDNYVAVEGTRSDWGFSCLINTDDQQILFDTGTQPQILMNNIGITKTIIPGFDQVVISHNHGDHTGGLWKILEIKSGIPVYLPHPPDPDLKSRIAGLGSRPESSATPARLTEHVWTSGTTGTDIREQCAVIQHEKGLIVVVGCSHPGISGMLKRIRKDFNREIYAVVGGFHLSRHTRQQVDKIIQEFRELGVQKCGCTHCTGDTQIQQFRDAYGKDFLETGTGRKLVF